MMLVCACLTMLLLSAAAEETLPSIDELMERAEAAADVVKRYPAADDRLIFFHLQRLRSAEEKIETDEPRQEDVSVTERVQLLNAWMVQLGLTQHGTFEVRPSLIAGAGVGIFATRATAANETLAVLPLELALTTAPESASGDREQGIDPLIRHASKHGLQLPSSVRLALRLLHELHLGQKSRWSGYVASLPTDFRSLPLWWASKQLKLLSGSPALRAAARSIISCVRFWGMLRALLLTGKAPPSTTMPAGWLTLQRFRWAMTVVITRQQLLPLSTETLALFPILDSANHCAEGTELEIEAAEAPTAHTPKLTRYTMRAPRDLAAGEEACIRYGKRSLSEFVLYSGFVPAELLDVRNASAEDDGDSEYSHLSPEEAATRLAAYPSEPTRTAALLTKAEVTHGRFSPEHMALRLRLHEQQALLRRAHSGSAGTARDEL